MTEESMFSGAAVLAVLGGFFFVVGLGMLLFLPKTLQGRGAVGAAAMGTGVLLLIILVIELSGGGGSA